MFDFKNSPIFKSASEAKTKITVPRLILILLLLFYIAQFVAAVPTGIVAGIASAGDIYEGVDENGNLTITEEEMLELLMGMFEKDAVIIASLFATVTTIGICIIFCKLIEKRSLSSMGFVGRRGFLHYVLGLVIGFVLFSFVYLICAATGAVKFIGFNYQVNIITVVFFFFAFLVQGMSEEVLMRGFFMVSAKNTSSLFTALTVSSILFATLHFSNSGMNGLAFLNLTLFGVFASLYMLRTGNIWGISAIHAVWNFAQGNVYGCLVSGMNLKSTLMSTEINVDRMLTNGGEFGPEGGVAVTLILLIAIIFVVYLPAKNAGETKEEQTEE